MRVIKAFQVLPEGRMKDRLRCLFYNRRMRRYGLSIKRGADGFDVQYRHARVTYDSNPYYKGLATVAGYFEKGGLRAGDTVIDAGACEGAFTLLAARMVGERGRVIAFEPDPENAARLAANLARNDLRNVSIVQKGLWRDERELRFHEALGMWSKVADDDEEAPNAADATGLSGVPVTDLDGELRRLDIGSVDFIKADIEGAELAFVEGAQATLTQRHPRLAIASYHIVDGAETWPRLEAMLRDAGYRVETGFPEHTTTYAWFEGEASAT